ncbi:MAG: hypothetical protein K9N23_20015 [Akkermansiaceae bacterium]|nr:hypothetical protein [Akkermansiaceae bacterium]
MPRVIFIYPCIGRKPGKAYVRSWQMQPLAIAQLAARTPPGWERVFYDDRMETVPVEDGDLCAISIETYTARRGYQLAAEYKKRGVPVVFGGYHVVRVDAGTGTMPMPGGSGRLRRWRWCCCRGTRIGHGPGFRRRSRGRAGEWGILNPLRWMRAVGGARCLAVSRRESGTGAVCQTDGGTGISPVRGRPVLARVDFCPAPDTDIFRLVEAHPGLRPLLPAAVLSRLEE